MAVPLYFRQTGQGPFLIILHGFLGSSDNWISFARQMEERYTVILPDFRNHGRSPHTLTHTYEDMAEDLNLLFENQTIEKASIIGHSMGGKAAMMFAANYPDKTENLIVADAAPAVYHSGTNTFSSGEQNKTIIDLIDKLDLSVFSTRREIEEALLLKLKDATMRLFILKNISRDDKGKFKWKINVPVLRDSFNAVLQDVNREWFSALQPILNYPVTFIRGLESQYVTDKEIAVIKEIYPEAKVIDVPGAGHWLHTDQPDLFFNTVTEALKSKV